MIRYKITTTTKAKSIVILKSSLFLINAVAAVLLCVGTPIKESNCVSAEDIYSANTFLLICSILSMLLFLVNTCAYLNHSVDMNDQGVGYMLPVLGYERYRTWIDWEYVVCVSIYRKQQASESINYIIIRDKLPKTRKYMCATGSVMIPKSVGDLRPILTFIRNHACQAKYEDILIP